MTDEPKTPTEAEAVANMAAAVMAALRGIEDRIAKAEARLAEPDDWQTSVRKAKDLLENDGLDAKVAKARRLVDEAIEKAQSILRKAEDANHAATEAVIRAASREAASERRHEAATELMRKADLTLQAVQAERAENAKLLDRIEDAIRKANALDLRRQQDIDGLTRLVQMGTQAAGMRQ